MSAKDKIKNWHSNLLWTDEMVAKAVARKIITTTDYEEITGRIIYRKTQSELKGEGNARTES